MTRQKTERSIPPPGPRVDLLVRVENKTGQPPPDIGASRRQLSAVPGERRQLPSPCARQGTTAATWALRTQQSPATRSDRVAHVGPLDVTYAATRTQRPLDGAN